MRDRAVTDVDHLVRPVLAQPGSAIGAHRELDPGPPAESGRVAGHLLHRYLPLDARDAAQLLAHDRCFQLALGRQAGMLPVAAAAASRPGLRAGRLDPAGRGLQDFHGVGPGQLGRRLGDDGPDPLAGQRMPDEDHLAVIRRPGHAPATMRGLADAQLDQIACVRRVTRGGGHPTMVAWRRAGAASGVFGSAFRGSPG